MEGLTINNEKCRAYDKELFIDTFNKLPTSIKKSLLKNVKFVIGDVGGDGQYMESTGPDKTREREILIDSSIITKEREEFFKEVFYHEVGHYVREFSNEVRLKRKDLKLIMVGFKKIYLKERKYFKNPYYKQKVCEYFAQSFAMMMLEPEEFSKKCPDTLKYIITVIRNCF